MNLFIVYRDTEDLEVYNDDYELGAEPKNMGAFKSKKLAQKFIDDIMLGYETRYREINDRLDSIEAEMTELFTTNIDAPIPPEISKEYDDLEFELLQNKDLRQNLVFTIEKIELNE